VTSAERRKSMQKGSDAAFRARVGQAVIEIDYGEGAAVSWWSPSVLEGETKRIVLP
jgi:hypothetical protein